MKLAGVIKKLEARQKAVGEERDKLDTFISEATDLKESCNRAWGALQDARDALSELV
jgi:predicted nuclease with TOPRIM domain